MSLLTNQYTLPNGDIDILSMGEVLLDLISVEEDVSLTDAISFNRHFGGSAANVAINCSRLGEKAALVSRIGRDYFGEYIAATLRKENIILEGLQFDENRRTPVIFVNKSKDTPDWLAYRGADKFLQENDIIYNLIDRCKIFHLTTFILSSKPARDTVIKYLEYALSKGKIITYDPCFRASLWPEGNKGKKIVSEIINKVHFIKPSLDDAFHLFGHDTPLNYIKKYLKLGAKLVILTMGGDGAMAADGKQLIKIPPFPTKVIDVTGAGDSFWAGFISGILAGFPLKRAVKFGSGVAAFKISGVGAFSPVPDKATIIETYKI